MDPTHTLRATPDADDCTFRPSVSGLPRKLYPEASRPDDGDFLQRTERWAERRDAHVQRRRAGL